MKRQAVNQLLLGVALVSTISFSTLAVAAGDAAAGKAKSMSCAGCHGADGMSFSPDIPNLKGQKEGYLVKAINDYKSGARKNPMMTSMVGSLKDQDVADLAAFYAGLK